MALIVEDGTGKSDAESYGSASDFKDHCTARGWSWTGFDDAALEAKLRLATSYIDTIGRFKGSQASATQALEWPRSGCIDWSGREASGIPRRIVLALFDLTYLSLTNDLFQVLDRGGMVKSESVGPISTTYMDGAPATRVFEAPIMMLQPYWAEVGPNGMPVPGGRMTIGVAPGGTPETTNEANFTLGMHDNGAQSSATELE